MAARRSARFGGAPFAIAARAPGSAQDISSLSLEAMRRMLIMKDSEMNRVVLPEKQRAELKQAVNSFCGICTGKKFRAIDMI